MQNSKITPLLCANINARATQCAFLYFRQESSADQEEVSRLHAAMCETVPVEKLQERRIWRDRRLAALAKLKRDMDKTE